MAVAAARARGEQALRDNENEKITWWADKVGVNEVEKAACVGTNGVERRNLLADVEKFILMQESLNKGFGKEDKKRDDDNRVVVGGEVGDKRMSIRMSEKLAMSRMFNQGVLFEVGMSGNLRDADPIKLWKWFKAKMGEAKAKIQENEAPADDAVVEHGIVFGVLKDAVGNLVMNSRFWTNQSVFEDYCKSKGEGNIMDFSSKGGDVTDNEGFKRVCQDFQATLSLIGHPGDAGRQPMRPVILNLMEGMESVLCDPLYIKDRINVALQNTLFKFSIKSTEEGPIGAGGGAAGGGAAVVPPVVRDLTGKFALELEKEMEKVKFTEMGSKLYLRQVGAKAQREEESEANETGRPRRGQGRGGGGRTGGRGGRGMQAALLPLPPPVLVAPGGRGGKAWCLRSVVINYFCQSAEACFYTLSCRFRHDTENLKYEPQEKQDAFMVALANCEQPWATSELKKACADRYQRDGGKFK